MSIPTDVYIPFLIRMEGFGEAHSQFQTFPDRRTLLEGSNPYVRSCPEHGLFVEGAAAFYRSLSDLDDFGGEL